MRVNPRIEITHIYSDIIHYSDRIIDSVTVLIQIILNKNKKEHETKHYIKMSKSNINTTFSNS